MLSKVCGDVCGGERESVGGKAMLPDGWMDECVCVRASEATP